MESALSFEKAIQDYLEMNIVDFDRRIEDSKRYEKSADNLRRLIEEFLYEHTLIPENRGDVLAILENTDIVINHIKETMLIFSIEHPEIPASYHQPILSIAGDSCKSVLGMIEAIRAFFTDLNKVKEYNMKVDYYEQEVDITAEKVKRLVFQSDLELASKMHLRYVISTMEGITDYAQDVCERLAIYTIKRQL